MGSIPNLSILKGPQREFHPKFLHRLFEQNIPNYKNKAAIINNDDSISYNELNKSSNQIARAIIHETEINQSKPNSDSDWIVAVCMEPSYKLLVTLLSIWKAGAAYLPLEPSFPENRIHHILNEAKPFLVICDNNINKNVFRSTSVITIDEALSKAVEFPIENVLDIETLSGGDNDLGLVLYTSGSTGIPKGVRLPHSVILNRLQWQWERFPYSKSESVGVFKTALTFVDSVTEIWGPLLSGLSVLVIEKNTTKDPEKLVNILDKYKIERLVLVPTLLRSLLMYLSMNKSKKVLSFLKLWVSSGEPLSISLVNDFYDYFEEEKYFLCNFYGSTEVMGDVTYFLCEGKQQLNNLEKVPIGTPVNNTVIYLLDDDYRPVKIGDIGEIFVSGLNLANGYVNGRDSNRFIENPLAVDSNYSRIYRTGDFGKVEKGMILYEGRSDTQIKIRGHRVDLSEIENNIATFDFIEKAIVLCYHVGEIDQSLLAFVIPKKGSKIVNGLQVESSLKNKLATYMIPQVIIIDNIPLLVNGKVDRQSLLKLYENTNNNDDVNIELDYDYTGVPVSLQSIAKDLFEIVGGVIGRSTRMSLSLSSNFYNLGGNSLNSIYTVTKLREKGYFISITEFIAAKNLGQILETISKDLTINPVDETDYDYTSTLTAVPLELEHKSITIEIITTSFYGKADLEQWLKPHILITDYEDILEEIWEELVEKDLSFVVKNEFGKIIGVALNFDAHDEPQVQIRSKLSIIFDFLEYLEGPIRDNCLPKGVNQILHSFMMGTSEVLSAQENIMVMHFMEHQVLELAKRKKFVGIFTTNTNPLTQQLGTNVYKYKIMLDYQVNQYTHFNGTKPFAAAPDEQRAIVHWKELISINETE